MEVGENPSSAATDTPVALNSGEKQQRLKLNFAELFGDDHDEPTPEIKVVAAEKRRKNREKERKSANDDPPPANSHGGDDFSSMSVIELKGTIERQTKNLALAGKLRDRGEKLKAKLKCLEEELQRRELRHKETSNQASSAFVREISCLNPCDKSKRKATVKLPQSKRAKPGLSAKEFYAWKPKDQSPRNGVKNGKQAGRVSSFGSLPLLNEKTADTNKNEDSQALNTNGSIKDKAVVLVDEEAPELIEKKQKANDLPSTPNDGKIYYPSREDPESLEIFRSELKCLEPEECLTSTIMNFYISLLINEWNILNKDVDAVSAPIPEKIWQRLPRRIENKYIVFGKHWFKPQEASSLRGKIKKILQEEFKEEPKQDSWTWEPVCLPVNAETTKSKDLAEIS
uniref:Uncharacterized protein n=1 Tax=Chenopodium quinoa TaxID=63459 RepID=A0A803LJ87_CHEQI